MKLVCFIYLGFDSYLVPISKSALDQEDSDPLGGAALGIISGPFQLIGESLSSLEIGFLPNIYWMARSWGGI
jgi:hypothetical protein